LHSKTVSFLEKLAGVKPARNGQYWKAWCPAHNDRDSDNPSLEVAEGREGIVLTCRSHGCNYADICRAVGWEPRQLFWEMHDERRLALVGARNGNTRSMGPRKEYPVSKPTRGPIPPAASTHEWVSTEVLVAEHYYLTEAGKPAGLIRRYHRTDPSKSKGYRKECKQYRWDAVSETYLPGLEGVQLPLYNLDNLINASPGECIVWVEGENKVDALTEIGILATTASGGTGRKNTLPDLSILKRHPVVILPDADEPGHEYAQHVYAAVSGAGGRPSIQYDYPNIEADDLFPGFDVVDYLRLSGDKDTLKEALKPPPVQLEYPLYTVRELLALPSPEWQIEGFIQEECLYLLFGESSHGKSFVALDVLLNVSHGGQWCGKEIKKPGPAIYINADGGRGFRDRVEAWFTYHQVGEVDAYPLFTLNTDIQLHENIAVDELRRSIDYLISDNPAILIVDTYSRCNAGRDENNQGESSQIIRNLDRLRKEYNCSCGVIHHTGADGLKVRGSTVLLGAVDSAWRVVKNGNGHIEVACSKQRNGNDRVEGMNFTLERVPGTNQVALFYRGGVDPLTETVRARREILEYIQDFPNCTQADICQNIGFSQPRVSEACAHHLAARNIRKTGNPGRYSAI